MDPLSIAKRTSKLARNAERTGRCAVALCFAQSLDGVMASSDRTPIALSGPTANVMTHALRAEADHILVGIDTVLADNPLLTVRQAPLNRKDYGHPRAVIVDTSLRIHTDCRLVQTAGELADGRKRKPPLVFCSSESMSTHQERKQALEELGITVIGIRKTAHGTLCLQSLCEVLTKEFGASLLMVEGGPRLLSGFVKCGRWDLMNVTVSPMLLLREGVRAWPVPNEGALEQAQHTVCEGVFSLPDNNVVLLYSKASEGKSEE